MLVLASKTTSTTTMTVRELDGLLINLLERYESWLDLTRQYRWIRRLTTYDKKQVETNMSPRYDNAAQNGAHCTTLWPR